MFLALHAGAAGRLHASDEDSADLSGSEARWYSSPEELAILYSWRAAEAEFTQKVASKHSGSGELDESGYAERASRHKEAFVAERNMTVEELDALIHRHQQWHLTAHQEREAAKRSEDAWFVITIGILVVLNIPLYLMFARTIFGGRNEFAGTMDELIPSREHTLEGRTARGQIIIFIIAVVGAIAAEYGLLMWVVSWFT